MIDTSHIDPHWPVDAQAQAAEQPPLPLLTISKSEIATLRRCPRLYYFEYVLGRTPAKGPGIEAEWGTALHRGLESFELDLKSCEEHGLAIAWDLAVRDAITWAMTPGVDQDGRDYTPPADPYAKAALRAMLRAYAAVWGADDAERYEVVAVELPFDLPVLTAEGRVSRGRREGARREGRIDALVRERVKCPACEGTGGSQEDPCTDCLASGEGQGNSAVWLVEHKSTGKHPEDERWYVGIELELQPSLYFDAARELGHDPAGVIYDVVRRPDFDDPKPPPQLKKNGTPRAQKADVQYTNPRHGEPASVYEERVYQLALARPTDFFHRRALTIEPWQVEESREDVRAAALEIAWRTRSQAWPRVGDRYVCGARGRVCPWLDVCGHVESAENDKLYPLKSKKESKST